MPRHGTTLLSAFRARFAGRRFSGVIAGRHLAGRGEFGVAGVRDRRLSRRWAEVPASEGPSGRGAGSDGGSTVGAGTGL